LSSPGGPIAAYRRFWAPELIALGALALGSTVLFSVTDLDIAAARRFYHPELPDPWPVASHPLWSLFYRSAPWVTGSLAVTGVALLVAGVIRRKSHQLRLYGLFILLCVVIGPGLIVNAVLKDHWGRPRPRQIVELGGRLEYAPPLLPSGTHGKSFPCGHCSVGYLYAVGWWLWRRRRPRWAAGSLAAGTVLGTLLGIGRMAAGGHFLSDVVWSGLIALGVAHILYYYGLRIPAREEMRASLYPRIEQSPRLRAAVTAAAILLGAGIILGGALATPHHEDLTARVLTTDFPAAPEAFEVIVDTLDVEVRLVAGPPSEIVLTGTVHAFGLPTSRIRASWEFREEPVPTLRYRVARKGWFTDVDGVARFRLPFQDLRRITVRAGRGDIRVEDATGGQAAGRLPALDLFTADGRVRKP
jgi:lipid A 4'-phosphatase